MDNLLSPYVILGVDPQTATDLSVRKAYMDAVMKYPPDRHPDTFEKIRSAYEKIATERQRIRLRLFQGEDRQNPLDALPKDQTISPIPAEMWIRLIEAEMKRKS